PVDGLHVEVETREHLPVWPPALLRKLSSLERPIEDSLLVVPSELVLDVEEFVPGLGLVQGAALEEWFELHVDIVAYDQNRVMRHIPRETLKSGRSCPGRLVENIAAGELAGPR